MSATKADLLKIIHLKCLECTLGQRKEVVLCPSQSCPFWKYRMGKDPDKTPRRLTEAQRAALAAGRQKNPRLKKNL